ncbi:MAG TPA: hypothetical protein VI875_01120 [Candidatus Norongarragalinales archaeon]|nr:hypothetical protein [Candidatus Norongarragalinales archaeon]
MADSMFMVGHAVKRDVDRARLSTMADPEFEREVDQLSEEIILEIDLLKKRYYEQGFKEALKQVKNAPDQPQTQIVLQSSREQPATIVSIDATQLESRFSPLEQKMSEFSDRIAAVEQTLLSSPSRDEELREIIAENRDLVGTLKSKVSEIAVLQSSIEEKLSQVQTQSMPSSELYEKIESMKTQIDNLGNLIVEEGGKVNAFEKARKSSVRRLDRKLNSLAKKLVDFKKVRKQIRKQGSRITKLSKGVVEKTSFKTAIKRVSAKAAKVSAAKPAKRKAALKPKAKVSATVSASKPVRVQKTRKAAVKMRKAVRKAPKKAARASRRGNISISAPAQSTVEITTKK